MVISSTSCVCQSAGGVGAQGEMGAGGGVTDHEGGVPCWNLLNSVFVIKISNSLLVEKTAVKGGILILISCSFSSPSSLGSRITGLVTGIGNGLTGRAGLVICRPLVGWCPLAWLGPGRGVRRSTWLGPGKGVRRSEINYFVKLKSKVFLAFKTDFYA